MSVVPNLSDIEQDVKNAFRIISNHRARAASEAEQKVQQIELIPFQVRSGSGEIVAIDGSYAPIFRAGSIWIVATRAVALAYTFSDNNGYEVKDCASGEEALELFASAPAPIVAAPANIPFFINDRRLA